MSNRPAQRRWPSNGPSPASDAEDRILVQQTLDGDHESFGLLVDRYQRVLFNAAFRMVGDYDEATDVVQSAFVRAFRRLSSYNPRYKFFSWIYRILVNHALNTLRRRKPVEPLDPQMPSSVRGPDEQVEQKQLHDQIQAALLRLTPDYREVIVLRHFLDLTYRDISDLIQVPEKTVKSRLHTARRQLADQLFPVSAKAKSG